MIQNSVGTMATVHTLRCSLSVFMCTCGLHQVFSLATG